MTDPQTSIEQTAATATAQPKGSRGTGSLVWGIVLAFMSIFSLPRGLSLLLLSIVRPGSDVNVGASLGLAIFGAALLTSGIVLIVRGAKRRKAYNAA